MTRFVDVTHAEWIAAPVETVRTQFADIEAHGCTARAAAAIGPVAPA